MKNQADKCERCGNVDTEFYYVNKDTNEVTCHNCFRNESEIPKLKLTKVGQLIRDFKPIMEEFNE